MLALFVLFLICYVFIFVTWSWVSSVLCQMRCVVVVVASRWEALAAATATFLTPHCRAETCRGIMISQSLSVSCRFRTSTSTQLNSTSWKRYTILCAHITMIDIWCSLTTSASHAQCCVSLSKQKQWCRCFKNGIWHLIAGCYSFQYWSSTTS